MSTSSNPDPAAEAARAKDALDLAQSRRMVSEVVGRRKCEDEVH